MVLARKFYLMPIPTHIFRNTGKSFYRMPKKLNELILELIEFRRLETGHKQLSIIRLSASENIQNMAASFNELAESRNINYQLKITQNIDWNSDLSCLNKIVNNFSKCI